VAVRMAVLYLLTGGSAMKVGESSLPAS